MYNQYDKTAMELLPELESILDETMQYESEAAAAKPKMIWLHNTQLGAPYVGGNFNFLYNPKPEEIKNGISKAIVTFNTFLSYRQNYPEAEKKHFEKSLQAAVNAWDSKAELQIKKLDGNYDRIMLRFKLRIVTNPVNANKKTDIHPLGTWSTWFIGSNDRAIVMRDLNVFIKSTPYELKYRGPNSLRNDLIHELGHVWGLEDEYDANVNSQKRSVKSWFEMKFSPAHVGPNSPLLKDKMAIMNEGYRRPDDSGEFRGRYFQHFGKALLKSFWGLKEYMIPIVQNGRTIAQTIQGRIVLLKKDIKGSAPYTNDQPYNLRYTPIQIAKR